MDSLVRVENLASEQERFALDIVESKGANLPATIDEIIPILAFSQAKMKAYNALSDAAKKVQDQESLNKAALESGQRWGIVHLYGQKRLGEITREIPKDTSNLVAKAARLGEVDNFFESKKAVLDKSGVKKWEATEAERIAAHPDILDRVIEEAKERGDIPTKTAVLKVIKAEQYKANVLDKMHDDAPDINEVANSIACKLGEMRVKIMKIWEHKDMLSEINIDGIRNAIEDIYDIVMGD